MRQVRRKGVLLPLYSFQCVCKRVKDEFFKPDDPKHVICKCGQLMKRIYTAPLVITDKAFPLTGTFDKRLGCKVEGRKHFKQKCEEKGFMELDSHTIKSW